MANPATPDTDRAAVPTAVPALATAVPAFIGYTPRAEIDGVSCYGKPVRIRSFEEFRAWFLLPEAPVPAAPVRQYQPRFDLVLQASAASGGLNIAGKHYLLQPDPRSIYYLYNSLRAFYRNGGAEAWIVAVGGYGPAAGAPPAVSDAALVNPHVVLDELLGGLQLLRGQPEPTLYLCPEAILLERVEHSTLMRHMLTQARALGTAVCLFDVRGGDQADAQSYARDIEEFRAAIGTEDLDRGVCYFPFIGTDLMTEDEFDYRNLSGGDLGALKAVLSPPDAPNPPAALLLEAAMTASPPELSAQQLHHNLLAASPAYGWILAAVRERANLLPASAALAGIYAAIDRTQGIWVAPANVGIVGATALPIQLDDLQQAPLNIDLLTGKSINVIRSLNGRGIVVWGDRTLDGNSPDWRFIQVRRTLIYIEQSIKAALQLEAFAPNNASTWAATQSLIENFLNSLWQKGALLGATPADAYAVAIGLGLTMTADDIQQGLMRVNVQLALLHPADFMLLTMTQQVDAASA